MKREELAQMIDHTLLKPEAKRRDVENLLEEASRLGTYSACVSPSHLPLDVPEGLKLAVVCGFPSGAHHAEVKAFEARQSVEQGAEEVDMVINLQRALDGDFQGVEDEIRAVREAIPSAVLKVILETAAMPDEAIVACCKAAQAADADFVKTSTGFHPAGGASVHAVQLMRATVGEGMGVKASGGIRDAKTALAMVEAGANRLGLSASAAVLEGLDA